MLLLNENLFRNAKSKTLNFIYLCSHHLGQYSSFHTSAVQLSFLGMCQFLKKNYAPYFQHKKVFFLQI